MMRKLSNAEIQQFLNPNASSKLRMSVESGDQMLSQDERAKLREKNYAKKVLKKVMQEDKDVLFASMKKGKNTEGGAYGRIHKSPEMKSTAGSSDLGLFNQQHSVNSG